MPISDAQWTKWLNALEEMLHEADVHREAMFAIHINSAIETAYARLGKNRPEPNFDQQFNVARDL